LDPFCGDDIYFDEFSINKTTHVYNNQLYKTQFPQEPNFTPAPWFSHQDEIYETPFQNDRLLTSPPSGELRGINRLEDSTDPFLFDTEFSLEMEPDGVLFLEPSNEKLLPDGVLYLSDGREYVSADSHQPAPSLREENNNYSNLSSADILSEAISNSPQSIPEENPVLQAPLEPANRFVDLHSSEKDGCLYDVLSNYMLAASPYIKASVSSTSLGGLGTSKNLETLSASNMIPYSGYNSVYPPYCSYPYFSLFPQLPVMSAIPAQSVGTIPLDINPKSQINEGSVNPLKRTNEARSSHPSQFASKEDYFKSALREQQLQRYRMKKMRRVYARPVDERRSQQAKNRERNSRGRFVINK
jgi:hypothetical protein